MIQRNGGTATSQKHDAIIMGIIASLAIYISDSIS
jgi:hypothetical protein